MFAHYAGWDWPTVSERALRYVEPIEAVYPQYLEEIRGIAEGAGVGFTDVMAINTRTEVMFAAKAAHAGAGPSAPPGCTGSATLPPAASTVRPSKEASRSPTTE